MKRYWIVRRQAYTPRLWPLVPPVALIAAALAFVITPPMWLLVPAAALIGWGASRLQWWWWRRRHPELPREVVTREIARWN